MSSSTNIVTEVEYLFCDIVNKVFIKTQNSTTNTAIQSWDYLTKSWWVQTSILQPKVDGLDHKYCYRSWILHPPILQLKVKYSFRDIANKVIANFQYCNSKLMSSTTNIVIKVDHLSRDIATQSYEFIHEYCYQSLILILRYRE